MNFLSHVMIRYFVLESWMPDSIQSGKRPNCTRSFINVLKIFQRLEILKTNLPYKAQRKERYNTVYPWVCVNHLCLNMYAEYLLEVIFLEYFSLDTWIFIDNLKLIPSCGRKDGKIFSEMASVLPCPILHALGIKTWHSSKGAVVLRICIWPILCVSAQISLVFESLEQQKAILYWLYMFK